MNGQQTTPFMVPKGLDETQKDLDACSEEIDQALKRWACRLVFEQVTQNGVPIGGRP